MSQGLTWVSLRLSRPRGDILAPAIRGLGVAQKVSVSYACDFDQKEIPEGQHRLRRFSFDGRDYQIDLCQQHSDKFDEAVGRYAEYARTSSAPALTTPGLLTATRPNPASSAGVIPVGNVQVTSAVELA